MASVQLTESLPQPPAQVWRALTDPALLAKWSTAEGMRPVPGHQFSVHAGPLGPQDCQILAVDPLRLLSYSFAPHTLHTAVTWRLEPQGQGTRICLEHAGFETDTPQGQRAFEGMGAGWPRILARLASVIAAQG